VYCGGAKPGIRCVKKGDWKLLEYETNDSRIKVTQLFNLKQNPDELLSQHGESAIVALVGATPDKTQVNLADDPSHAEKLSELRAALLAEMRRLDDPFRYSWQPDDGLPRNTSASPKPGKAKKK
ncbi:MAG TPA: hypothetical protein PLV92_18325, partial [Pirellulaceae bacterium]|nr:hypothetical protein [Pirellulaceae bacterium]